MTFREKVLQIVREIPRGCVKTYGEIAELAGNHSAARAVGQIMKKNFDPNIPCHRVISARGIGGYNRGICNKLHRLAEEGVCLESLSLNAKKAR